MHHVDRTKRKRIFSKVFFSTSDEFYRAGRGEARGSLFLFLFFF